MKQRQIIFRFLFPPRQDAAKAVHPAMGTLHHPTTGFETGLMLNRLRFFTTRTNVSGIAKFFHQVAYLTRIITFIKTHPLLFLFCRRWPFHRNTFYRGLGHFAVMAVGAINRHPHRNLGTVRQQTAFNAFFSSVRGVGAGFFPHPAGPLSWPHPSIAKTSQCLSVHHNRPTRLPRVSKKHLLVPILETANGPYCWNKYRFHLMRSIGSRSAGQKISHPSLGDPALSVCRRQSGVYWDAWVSMVRFSPISRLKFYIDSLFFVFSSLNPFKGIVASDYIGYSGVFRIGSKKISTIKSLVNHVPIFFYECSVVMKRVYATFFTPGRRPGLRPAGHIQGCTTWMFPL